MSLGRFAADPGVDVGAVGWTLIALGVVEGDEDESMLGDPGATVGAVLTWVVAEDEGEDASEDDDDDGEAFVGDADEVVLHSSATIAAGRT